MNRRVLIVVENLSVPTDRRVWQEALSLTSAGWEVSVLCPRGSERDVERFIRIDQVDIHRFDLPVAGGGILGYVREYSLAAVRIARAIRRLARVRRFDVVHVCNPPDFLVPLVRLCCARDTRIVFDQHDLVPELFITRFGDRSRLLLAAARGLERLSYRLADVVIVTNESYRRIAQARGQRAPDGVFVVRNGPNLEKFTPGEPDISLRRGKTHLIAYAGVMGQQDGVERALEALACLRTRRLDWHALFAGDGDRLPGLRKLATELGLDECVEFTGWLSSDQLVSVLSSADVCVAPEPPTPLNSVSTLVKIAEYMAMGKPVVCQDLPESRVTAGDAAIFSNDGHQGLAAAIETVLSDSELRSQMGAAARKRAVGHLSWNHSEQQLFAAYERVAIRPPITARPSE